MASFARIIQAEELAQTFVACRACRRGRTAIEAARFLQQRNPGAKIVITDLRDDSVVPLGSPGMSTSRPVEPHQISVLSRKTFRKVILTFQIGRQHLRSAWRLLLTQWHRRHASIAPRPHMKPSFERES
jgi:hypothetical protein